MPVVLYGINTQFEAAWHRRAAWVLVLISLLAAPVPGWCTQVVTSVQRLPHLLVALPESHSKPAHAIVVEKSTQTLTVYRYNGSYQKIAEYPCSTGKRTGDKQISGDMKTPEGAYFFTTEYLDNSLGPLYGSRALPMDYPNIADRRDGKGGFAIWMHGTNRPLLPRDSNGCIALENKNIDEVRKYVDLKRTPILVADTVEYVELDSAERIQSRLASFLELWRQALVDGTYHQYLAFFDAAYLPPIQWWTDWRTLRSPTHDSQRPLRVQVEALAVYRHRDLLVATFEQVLVDGDHRMPAGIRKLFIRETDSGYRLVGDGYHPDNGPGRRAPVENPLVAAARRYRTATEPGRMLQVFLDKWLKAWSAGDIEAYGECYAESFRSRGMNRNQWLAYKKELNRRYEYIAVSGTDATHHRNGDNATIRFRQIYESNTFKARGFKTLHLRLEAGQWKITREIYDGK